MAQDEKKYRYADRGAQIKITNRFMAVGYLFFGLDRLGKKKELV